MKYTTVSVVASAGLAAAQTPTGSAAGSAYSCAAQNIVSACLGSTEYRLTGCPPNDWDCMCASATDVATCYNNCPGHPDQFGAQQKVTQYCAAAKQYGSSALAAQSASTAGSVKPTGAALASTLATATATIGLSTAVAAATGPTGATAGMAPNGTNAAVAGAAVPVSLVGGLAGLLALFL